MYRSSLLLFVCTFASALVMTYPQEPSAPANTQETNLSSSLNLSSARSPRNVVRSGGNVASQNYAVASSFAPQSGSSKEDQQIQDAARALRTATSSEEKKNAEATLRTLLADDYDSRLADYTKYLDEMEEKLKEMRTKLQRRHEAKSDMIDLRVKVLEAEADDLGWPSRVSDGSFPLRLRTDHKASLFYAPGQ